MKQNELPLPAGSFDGDRIRKVWHNEEWYYSVIDIISELMDTHHKRAKAYWATLKRAMIENGVIISNIALLKARSNDGKYYFTQFTNGEGVKALQVYLAPNVRRYRSRMEYRKDDEVTHFHPKVLTYLQNVDLHTHHHVRLASGNIIDIVAYTQEFTWVVECKPELNTSHLYLAIGQVMCYRYEYNLDAIPAIAAFKSKTTDYARMMCRNLGIELIEIEDDLVTERPLLTGA